ncbi:unnamed protein product [Zymoseptoria tritici ST99CH_3D1]|nr:unnamed protein product [Zymoseptoria tritici ST99CH_3D1]
MAYETYRYGTPRFMDDSVYRSGSSVSSSGSITRDPRNPRTPYISSPRPEYRQIAVDEHGMAIDPRRQYEDSLYQPHGQMSRSYRDEQRRRDDLDYTTYSSTLSSSRYPQIQPRLCRDGRYPPSFSRPLQVNDFLSMSDSDLRRLILAYELSCDSASQYGNRDRVRFGSDGRLSRRAMEDAVLEHLDSQAIESDPLVVTSKMTSSVGGFSKGTLDSRPVTLRWERSEGNNGRLLSTEDQDADETSKWTPGPTSSHILAGVPDQKTHERRTLYVEANSEAEEDKTKSPLSFHTIISKDSILDDDASFKPSEHWTKLQKLPSSNFHVIISTGSGTGLASHVYNDVLAPLLSIFDLTPIIHTTTSTSSITELTKSTFLPAALSGTEQSIILLSGDGGVLDITTTLLSSSPLPSTYHPPTLILLPLGTGNALANSSSQTLPSSLLPPDQTLNIRSLLLGTPHPLPLFRATFSPGSRILTNEGQTATPLHQDPQTGDHVAHGAVVLSWGFHATLVADSDTPEYRKHGSARFQLAAKECLYPADGSPPHTYKGKVSILQQGTWHPVRGDENEHAYVLTTLTSHLESTFTISPSSRPLDGKLRVIHFGPLPGDEIMEIMTKAYDGGKHVEDPRVGYEEVEAMRIEFEEAEERWRRVCVDGSIVRVEEGGWVEVRKRKGEEAKGVVRLVSCL